MLNDKNSIARVINYKANTGSAIMQAKQGYAQVMMERYQPQQKFETENKKGWVDWGEDNQYPQYLNFLYRNEGLHKAIIRGKASMIAGNGTGDINIDKVLNEVALNLALYEFAVVELIWAKDGSQVVSYNCITSASCRFSWDVNSFNVDGVWYSKDWTQQSKKKGKPTFIPLYNPLNVKNENGDVVQPTQALVILGTSVEDGRYYPEVSYSGGLSWIEVSRQAAQFHQNSLENGLFPSMMVTYKGDLTVEEMDEVQSNLEQQLQGASNTGKFIVNFTDIDGAVEFTPITTNEADKLYQWQVEAARESILQAHGVTTPLLFGIRTATGFGGNAEEMKTGEKMFIENVIQPYQQCIEKAFQRLGLSITIQPKASIWVESAPVQVQQMDEKKKEVMQESFPPTDEMAREAELGLKWREEYGRGGTEVGVARARDISNKRNLSLETVQRMNSYFSRHEVDKQATGWNDGEEGFPTAGRIAWQLWGGDPGQGWAARIMERVNKEEQSALDEFIELYGETVDSDWICIDEYRVEPDEDDSDFFVSTGTARPNAKSSQDRTIDGITYYARYEYAGELKGNTRDFCRKMLSAGKVYRKEDVMAMGDKAVNPGWGPRGVDKYSIWLYKGGGNCHHFWKKKIYVSAKDLGVDINSPKAKTIAAEKAAAKGFKPRNNRLVAVKPIDMPNNGFLPKD